MALASQQSGMNQLYGVAAADLANDSRDLLVYPTSLLPFQSGELQAMEVDAQISTSGTQGAYKSQAKITNVLKCLYRDDSSSGSTPPRVRKGEQVLIYNMGDTDTWYWKSEGREDGTRRTDVWRKAISGTLKNVDDLNDDSAYFIEINTRDCHRIRISTSMGDGEKHRYIIDIDCDKSQVYFGDEQNNQFFIDSENTTVGLRNHDDSMVILDKKNIVITCDEDITIDSKNGNVNTHSKLNTTIDAETTMDIKSVEAMTQSTQATLDVSSKDAMTQSTQATLSVSSQAEMTHTSQSTMTQTAQGDLLQSTQQSWGVKFMGNGTCDGGTGNWNIRANTIDAQVNHFDVH